jgi:hypothetical protein
VNNARKHSESTRLIGDLDAIDHAAFTDRTGATWRTKSGTQRKLLQEFVDGNIEVPPGRPSPTVGVGPLIGSRSSDAAAKTVRLSCDIEVSLHADFKTASAGLGLRMTELLRLLIHDYLAAVSIVHAGPPAHPVSAADKGRVDRRRGQTPPWLLDTGWMPPARNEDWEPTWTDITADRW